MATTAPRALNAAALAQLVASVGFPPSSRATAVAVALAESGGSVSIISVTGDYGLWQINRRAHGARYDFDRLRSDPAYNARAALDISSGGVNWSPWVAFKNGSYRRFLPAAEAAVGGGGITAATAVPNPVDVGIDIIEKLPGGGIITDALDEAGAAAEFVAGGWIDKLLTEGYRQALTLVFVAAGAALAGLGLSRISAATGVTTTAQRAGTIGAAAATGGASLAAAAT